MHQRGGTGNGITIALFDSGSSDHAEVSGKYVYESKVDIDCTTVIPGVACTPRVIGARDTHGHGTFIAGLLAAPRDGQGVVGVAPNSRIASVAIHTGHLSDGQYPSWLDGIVPEIDRMVELGALITNNSWGSHIADYQPGHVEDGGISAAEMRTLMPIDTYQAYVDADGVQVWAAGNSGARYISIESAAPFYFPDLEKGWLVVGAVNLDGGTSSHYSNWCGLAAKWCLVAPGAMGYHESDPEIPYEGVTGLALHEGHREWRGTSFAAPLVAAGIAALKSMFPNLTYHQIRDRILETADEGVFNFYPDPPPGLAHTDIYGHGLLDLDAASSPVGGTSLPMSGSACGPVVPTQGTSANLPFAAVERYFAGRSILALDNFQRAPFSVAADSLVARRGPQLALRDLRLGRAEQDGSRSAGYATIGLAETDRWGGGTLDGRMRGVFGTGSRVLEGMAAFAGYAGRSPGLYRMADDAFGLSLQFAAGSGSRIFAGFAANPTSKTAAARAFGAAGWAPRAVATLTVVPPDKGSSFGFSAAPGLERPMGWEGAGAFALSGDGYGVSYRREIASGAAYRWGFGGRLVHVETDAAPLVRFPDATMAAADIDLSLPLGERTVLEAGLGVERALMPAAGRLRLPGTIDGSGRIGFEEIRIDGADFLNLDRGTLNLFYAPTAGVSFGAGLAVVRGGFGGSQAIAGLQAEIDF